MSEAINIGAFSEALNNKMDLDMGNIPIVTKKNVTSFPMPNSRYDNLTLGASGVKYTAPANGYLVIDGTINANGRIKIASGLVVSGVIGGGSTNHAAGCFIPCKSGDEVVFLYSGLGDIAVRFVYAEGEGTV